MKTFLPGTMLVVLLTLGTAPLPAADTSPASPTAVANDQSTHAKMYSFLTPTEREKFLTAEKKALQEHPEIKTERDGLIKQKSEMEGAPTPEFVQQWQTYREKVKAAMLKDDPTLAPIFDKIEKHWAEYSAKMNAVSQPKPPAKP